MLQVPNLPNYTAQPSYTPMAPAQQPNYNAVKIDIHNPSVGTNQAQYAPVTAPYYSYPQTQLYNYPQAGQQPYYIPYIPQVPVDGGQPYIECPLLNPPVQNVAAPTAPVVPAPAVTQATAPAAAQVVTPETVQQPQQVNINQAPQAAPVVTEAPQAPQPAEVEIAQPAATAPQVDLNGFIARLADPDFEVQANTMEEIANMVKEEPQKATELLDAKIIDTLTNIINVDSSKLAGPTQEQIAARQKMMDKQQISEQEKALALTITPMEQAERNKSYAMFTSAILEKLYGEEVKKLTGVTVPLTELPAAMTIVDQLKDNPNPMVRTSAIEALSYIQNPEYKKDLTTLFTIAQNDQDKGVQEAAIAAIDKLNQV